jgi:arylsulfatase A-like enzyme
LVAAAEQYNRAYNHWRSNTDYNANGIDIFNQDWDNLIILDGCRYDKFSEIHNFDGDLESRISRGSKTWEFVRANFRDKELYDTVYISDNPWYGKLAEELNSELYHYELFNQDSFDETVTHPKTATDEAIEYASRFDDKRCIIHYYQPHEPYFNKDGTERHRMVSTCPARQRYEGYSQADIIDAYESTLSLVLTEIKRLLAHLDGKTVITADHGELLGERMWPIPMKNYEHPEGVYVDELVRVPWFVINHQNQKQIVEAEQPAEKTKLDDEVIEEQLQSLGYL